MPEYMTLEEAIKKYTTKDGEVVITDDILILPPERTPTSKRIQDAEKKAGKTRRVTKRVE